MSDADKSIVIGALGYFTLGILGPIAIYYGYKSIKDIAESSTRGGIGFALGISDLIFPIALLM